MDENEINLLKAIHNNIQIKIGDEITCPMLGLPQGLIQSPLFFNIFIEDIFEKLEKKFTGEMLGFADDMVLIVENIEELQPTIRKAI